MGVGAPSPGNWGNDNSDTQGGIDTVRVKFTAGTAGAVPSFPLSMSQGVVSVTKSGTTGQYDIVFQNAMYQSGGFKGDVLQASFAASGVCTVVRTAENAANGTVSVTCLKGDGTGAAYLASGDVITLVFERQRYKSQ